MKKKLPTLPSDVSTIGNPTGGVDKIEPIIFPNLAKLYQRRLGRIALLKERMGKEGNAYLDFIQKLVERQQLFLNEKKIPSNLLQQVNTLEKSQKEISLAELKKLDGFFKTFKDFIGPLLQDLPAETAKQFEELDEATFLKQSSLLLGGDFSKVESQLAIPTWGFLSLCFVMGRDLSKADDFTPTNSDVCPCCGSLSSGSIYMTGNKEGLRYCQCSLCEARWHKVRAICILCGDGKSLDYWMIEDKKSPIEAESCGKCKTYSKIFRLDRDSDLEVVVDDLTSLSLDILVEEKGFTRNGINPFSLPV